MIKTTNENKEIKSPTNVSAPTFFKFLKLSSNFLPGDFGFVGRPGPPGEDAFGEYIEYLISMHLLQFKHYDFESLKQYLINKILCFVFFLC